MSASLLAVLLFASITYTDCADGLTASDDPPASTYDPIAPPRAPYTAPVIEPVPEPIPEITEPIIEPVVAPEPVTQQAPVCLTDDEMLQWIITRESHGDPCATNGKYKGIGQLDESYYPTYVGLTWAECEGNYDIQLEAMLGYIASRYGSIQGAYEFWQWNGWY